MALKAGALKTSSGTQELGDSGLDWGVASILASHDGMALEGFFVAY